MNTITRWMQAALPVMLLALLFGGGWFYRVQEQTMRQAIETDLSAVVRLKAGQITAWREERLGDAAVLSENPFFIRNAARFLADPHEENSMELRAFFRSLHEHCNYSDVLLVDPDGRVRLSLSGQTEIHSGYASTLAAALSGRKPVFTDLYTEPQNPTPHVSTVAPLFTGDGQTSRPVGAVILVCDASRFLYPLIQSWPTPIKSEETLLVRRDGDDVLFLNDLRYQPDTALKLRIPLSRTDVPAVMAVKGEQGVFEGKDYRGVEVLSVILPVPDSPWFMVAKIDTAEAFAAWRFRSVLILGLLMSLMGMTVVFGLVASQWEKKKHYRTLYQSEAALRASLERHSITLKSIGDAVIATDARGRVELMNPVAEALTGWGNEEARGKPLEEVFRIVNEQTRARVESPVARVLRDGMVAGLANHTLLIARDGAERPIADIGAPIRNENGDIIGVVLVFRDQTKERAAAAALEDSEKRYRRLFESAKDGILILDANTGKVVDVNPFLMNLLGYSYDALYGKHLWEIGCFKDIASSKAVFKTLQENEYIRYEDLPLEACDGRLIEVEFVSNAYLEDHTKVIQCNIRDITERVQQEREIELLNRLYCVLSHVSQAVVRAVSPDAFLKEACRIIVEDGDFLLCWIGYLDPATNTVLPVASWGEAVEYVTGITVYADDRPEGRGPTGTCIRERDAVVYNDFLHDPNTLPWQERAAPFGIAAAAAFPIESAGRVWGALTIYSDKLGSFSEEDVILLEKVAGDIGFALDNLENERLRKQQGDKLRKSELHLRTILQTANEGFWLIDNDIVTRDVNPRMCAILGRNREEILERKIFDFVDNENRATFEQQVSLRVQGEAGAYEIALSRPDGSHVFCLFNGTPLFDESGNNVGAFAMVTDITERKRAEEERRRFEERLQRAEKMEALGTLSGGVAHDLNNVLGIVVGYSELLIGDLDESSSARSYAMEILKAGQRAAAIVQDLLTLARRGVSNRKVLNLNNIVLECRNSPAFAMVLSYHPNIVIKTDLHADLLNVTGSSVHLEKSIINLVSNAVETMPTGGTLTVKTANCYLDKAVSGYDEVRQGDYVVLSVSDTGEGIPASDLKRIFEPFYTKKVMGRSGTGLGLAVVWGTVKDHLGYINVESEEGKGTTFTLYFPVTRQEISLEQDSISAAEYMGNGQSILVVDDVKEQRQLASTMLKKLNYDVVSVSSGEDAVKYVQEHAVDLMVLDMIMDPGMDGLDTYIKVLEIHPHQKAIIVSGFSETERVSKAQALGAGAYVKKPYVLEKLGLAVRKELDRSA
ncbi:MAG: PAS domain S-box protein [Syntrophobacteraceae bacterium]